ncbi:MAG: putative metal-dependent hydrolase [Acidobacteria bacterium]|nr:MAG: putative metal-dependent hydrolase [Acidobacteriota bacterium]
MADPRYPIGKFSFEGPLRDDQRIEFLEDIEQAPARLKGAVKGLTAQQLDTPYRDGGWTVRQVVHFKLALTEEEPTIRPYMEDRWAELPEAKTAPIELSLSLLEDLHKRWILMLRAIQPAEWKRTFRHPEIGPMTLEKNLALYAWHGRHHVAHVTALRERMGW